ncbi:MAG: pilus assembly protein PilM [Patescibacteria group bacterium]
MPKTLNFKKIFSLLNPAPIVGGLEVSESALRFVRIENGKAKKASLQLPPGIIVDGRIKDRPQFVAAAKMLHRQIENINKPVHAILSVPASDAYTQVFSMPFVAEKNLEETARLNLQMISPLDINNAYSGYQILGSPAGSADQLELLGAFANREIIDEFTGALKAANFSVSAVEFPALSLARLIQEQGVGLLSDLPYLAVYLSGDGANLLVVKNGNLYFNRFTAWQSLREEVGGRQLSTKDVGEFLNREVKKVVNFSTTRLGRPISNIFFLGEIKKEKLDFDVQVLNLKDFSGLASPWFQALGASLRGLAPRYKDRFITLSAVGVEKEYYRDAILNFIAIWRNVILASLGFVFLVLLVADSFLARISASVAGDLSRGTLVPLEEIQQHQNDVRNFNRNVDLAFKAKEQAADWSPLFAKLQSLAGRNITIDRVYVDEKFNALILGRASNDKAVLNFKETLAKQSNFKDVVLPLVNIKVNTDGTVSFSLNFKVDSLKF